MSAKGWLIDGTEVMLQGRTNGQLFDAADERGCVRLADCVGVIWRKMGGEWFAL